VRSDYKFFFMVANTFITEADVDSIPFVKKQPRWTYEHARKDYYKELPIGPGIDWFRGLQKCENVNSLLKNIKINIPDTFCFLNHERCWFTEHKNGGMKLLRDVEKEAYLKVSAEWGEGTTNVVIRKTPKRSSQNKNSTHVLDANALGPFFMNTGDDECMFQKFIPSKNATAAVIRVVWDSENPQKSFGYYLTGDNELTASSENKSLRVFTLKGVPREAKYMVDEVVRITTVFSSLRMQQMAVDLIRDPDDKWWFIQVKAFTLRISTITRKVRLKRDDSMKTLMDNVEDAEKPEKMKTPPTTIMAKCPVCQCDFRASTLTKKMTMKMMLELEHHLLKRNISLFHIRRVHMERLSRQYNVCNLCWSFYLAERELSHIARKLSCSVCVQPNKTVPFLSGLLERLPYPGRSLSRLDPICRQPRDELRLFDPDINPDRGLTRAASSTALVVEKKEEKLGMYRSKSGSALRSATDMDPNISAHLTQMRFMVYFYCLEGLDCMAGHEMVMSLECPFYEKPKKITLKAHSIEKMLVHYLFSEKVPKSVFKSQLKVRITGNNMEVSGSLDLEGIAEKGTLLSTVLLFNSKDFSIMGQVRLSLGFIVDEIVNTAYVALRPCFDCYVPTINYSSCIPLPPQWIFCSTRGRRNILQEREPKEPTITAERGVSLVLSASSPLFVPGRRLVSTSAKDSHLKYVRPQSASTMASTMASAPNSRPSSAVKSRPHSATKSRVLSRPQSAPRSRPQSETESRPLSASAKRTDSRKKIFDASRTDAIHSSSNDNEPAASSLAKDEELDYIHQQLQLLKEQLHA